MEEKSLVEYKNLQNLLNRRTNFPAGLNLEIRNNATLRHTKAQQKRGKGWTKDSSPSPVGLFVDIKSTAMTKTLTR
jgi:hypothetical protein